MPIHIDIQELRVFKAVFEQNGFRKAADILFVTQSAVSQTIANLEHKLDTQLLHRNPLKLTESGIRLLDHAHAVLKEDQAVLEDLKNIKDGIMSTLTLAMSGSVNQCYGHQLLKAFCSQSPLTKLKINVMPSRQIVKAIGGGIWELGFGPFQQTMPDLFETIPLFTEHRTLMISRDHPALKLLKTNPDQLLQQVPLIVSHLEDPDIRPAIDKLRDVFGSIWEVTDTNLRLSLVSDNLGIGYFDARLVAVEAVRETLMVLDQFDFSSIPLQFGIYYRKGKPLSAGALKFIDACRAFNFSNPD